MHGGERVEGRREWVVDVVLDVAGRLDVDHQEGSARPCDTCDGVQHLAGVRLVVHRVEGCDQVEGLRLVQRGGVAHVELNVGQS
jgi:hypothetical protein